MGEQHLAVASVAVPRHAWDDPRMTGFVEAVDRLNRLAEASPGFVWRHRGPVGHAALVERFGHADALLSLSTWRDYPALHAFTYRGLHGRYLSERERWFLPVTGPSTVLWWTTADAQPDPEHALARLDVLRREGPSPRAFTVLRRFRPDGTAEPPARRRGRRRPPSSSMPSV